MNTYVTAAERKRVELLRLNNKHKMENKNKEKSLGTGQFHN